MDQSELKLLYEQALEAGRKRDYPLAATILQELLIHTDQLPAALLYLGRAYHAMGEFHRAVQAIRLYLNAQPDSGPGHFFIGRSYFALGLMQPAIHHLRRSSELDRAFTPALGLLGLALLKAGKAKAAIALFEQALKLEPANPRMFTGYLNALLTQAIKLFYRRQYADSRDHLLFIQKHRPGSLIVHLYLAGIYRELGELELALRQFDLASKLAPQDPVLYLQKAVILLQKGAGRQAMEELALASKLLGGRAAAVSDPQELFRLMMMVQFQNRHFREALECARRILRLSYVDAETHAVMAECFVRLGELEKAKNHYLRAIDFQQQKLEFRYGLAAVLWEQGEYQQLRTLVEKILLLHPDDIYASYYQALSLPFLGEGYEKTIPLLQEQIHRHGPDPHLMNALGQEYLKADLPELSEGWFQRTLKRIENHERALASLIEVYRRLDASSQSMTAYADYLRHYPGNLHLRKEYAQFLFNQKSYSQAAAEIEKILPRVPRSTLFRKMLAASYQKSKRYAEAVLLYRDLLRESPKSEELLKVLTLCLEHSGSRPTAIALLKKASEVFPDRPSIFHLLGSMYLRDSELERAAEALRRAVSLFPEDWQTHRALAVVYRRMGNEFFADKFLKRAQALRQNKIR